MEQLDHHINRVMGGYKAALHNDRTSSETKEKAQETLDALEPIHESIHESVLHSHHVEGGLKAALHNPRVSEEKKEEIREKLGNQI